MPRYLADPLRRRVFLATDARSGAVVGVLCTQRMRLRRVLTPLASVPARVFEAAELSSDDAVAVGPQIADKGDFALLFTNFCVVASERRRGVGSQLVAAAAEESADAIAHVLQVLTDNALAYEWYVRRGFIPVRWRDEEWLREVNLGRIPRRARKILLARRCK